MKAFLFVGSIFSAFFIVLGFMSQKASGNVLANTVIAAGVLLAVFVATVGLIAFVKGRKES